MLQPKHKDWLNGRKNNPYMFEGPTSNLGQSSSNEKPSPLLKRGHESRQEMNFKPLLSRSGGEKGLRGQVMSPFQILSAKFPPGDSLFNV